MKTRNLFSVFVFLLFFVGLPGCIVINSGGCSGKETYTRTVELSEPMAGGSSLKVQTTNGSIIVQGQETPGCSIVAKVTGRAVTKERAQELAEQTEVRLEPHDGGLQTVIVPPEKSKKESICVGFEATVSHDVSLNAMTTNGKIRAVSLTGDMTAHTTNGNVEFSQIRANRIEAHTVNGSIMCDDVTGSLNAGTTNGSVHVSYGSGANAAVNAGINTVNGSISVALPKGCSAQIDAGTVNGKINSDVPVTVSGNISKNSLNGTIGAGEGKLSLRTVNGSIDIH